MSYKLLTRGVQRLSDGAFIPHDPRNMDWRDYQVWVAKGNMPEAADPPPAAPKDEIEEIKQRLAAIEARLLRA